MGFLGLDFFESKQDKKLENDAYNALMFPYGINQQNIIKKRLNQLFPEDKPEESLFNYIITKQKLNEIKLLELNSKELLELICKLNDSYITKDGNAEYYIVLAFYDLDIDATLNYPSVEDIKFQANELLNKTKAN